MQFAGQRTDMNLKPIGEPVNVLIKLSDDVVPDPDAILITGITPQQTQMDGLTEVEFLRLFHEEVATEGTIFVGYNTVRFDDEFMRYLLYRNFYDPYEWQYLDNRSRWDLLDVVRMTRALRPGGINWPKDKDGKPTNRLELLTKANNISHESAHDALSDVHAVIAVAQLIRDKQPKLFDFLLQLRDKKAVAKVVEQSQPFVYSSGKYSGEFEKTAVVGVLAKHPKRQGVLVFDLRFDPNEYAKLSVDELVDAWQWKPAGEGIRLPVKTLQYNRCPAVAPLSVLDETSQERLQISLQQVQEHFTALKNSGLAAKVLAALDRLEEGQAARTARQPLPVDARLYDGFLSDSDKNAIRAVRVADPTELSKDSFTFTDKRLSELLPIYKARNFSDSLSGEERAEWEKFRRRRLLDGGQNSRLATFFERLGVLAQNPKLSSNAQYLLEELQLYGQSIMPVPED